MQRAHPERHLTIMNNDDHDRRADGEDDRHGDQVHDGGGTMMPMRIRVTRVKAMTGSILPGGTPGGRRHAAGRPAPARFPFEPGRLKRG